MSSLMKRIKILADNEGMSVTAFEAAIGASKGVFSRALANGTDIQSKWLLNVVENYPQYSTDWLLTGKGEMLQGANKTEDRAETYLNAELEGVSNAVIHSMQRVISSQEVTIRSQEKTIVSLEKQLALLEREISLLRKD